MKDKHITSCLLVAIVATFTMQPLGVIREKKKVNFQFSKSEFKYLQTSSPIDEFLKIENPTKSRVEILSIQASCSCLEVLDQRISIPANEAIQIPFSINRKVSGTRTGEISLSYAFEDARIFVTRLPVSIHVSEVYAKNDLRRMVGHIVSDSYKVEFQIPRLNQTWDTLEVDFGFSGTIKKIYHIEFVDLMITVRRSNNRLGEFAHDFRIKFIKDLKEVSQLPGRIVGTWTLDGLQWSPRFIDSSTKIFILSYLIPSNAKVSIKCDKKMYVSNQSFQGKFIFPIPDSPFTELKAEIFSDNMYTLVIHSSRVE